MQEPPHRILDLFGLPTTIGWGLGRPSDGEMFVRRLGRLRQPLYERDHSWPRA